LSFRDFAIACGRRGLIHGIEQPKSRIAMFRWAGGSGPTRLDEDDVEHRGKDRACSPRLAKACCGGINEWEDWEMSRKRRGLRSTAGLTVFAVAVVTALLVLVPGALGGGVTGAGFTTVNVTYDGGDFCKNGTGYINCNLYEGKQYVWLNGGPSTAYVGDGEYFFAVLAPGGQHDPLDGGANNLSDQTLAPYVLPGTTNSDGSTRPSGDTYQDRTFSVTGGVVTNEGSHIFDDNKLNLMPYDDTTNNGGVYILAICSLKDGYANVTPSNCKYDAFKVAPGDTTTPPAADPTVTKDAAGSYDTTYTWDSAKSVAAPSTVNVLNGSATFHYTITATHSAGTDSNVAVAGNIVVTNLNNDDIVVNVSDKLSDNTGCTVKLDGSAITSSTDVTVPGPGDTGSHLTYSCSLGAVSATLTNTATVTWPEQLLNDGTLLAANSTSFTYPPSGYIAFTQNKIDECVTLTDTFDGSPTTLGVACVNNTPAFAKDAGNTLANWSAGYASLTRKFTFTYDRSVSSPSIGCVTKNNTATFATSDNALGDPTTGDNSASVTVCRVPPNTGALTMGFWQNKNGQGIISATNQANLGSWLRGYHPFSNAPSTGLATYVSNIIKAATCTSSSKTCNLMLRAQMLATALDVYFSDPALGGNQIGKYNGLGNGQAKVGDVKIDLTQICAMIDGTGGATCSGTYENVSSAFGGAASLTVSAMLAYQNTSDPAADAGAAWYLQVKAMQVLAKDAFDAINNNVAFQAP
jgi:hypothetical protein